MTQPLLSKVVVADLPNRVELQRPDELRPIFIGEHGKSNEPGADAEASMGGGTGGDDLKPCFQVQRPCAYLHAVK